MRELRMQTRCSGGPAFRGLVLAPIYRSSSSTGGAQDRTPAPAVVSRQQQATVSLHREVIPPKEEGRHVEDSIGTSTPASDVPRMLSGLLSQSSRSGVGRFS